MRTTPRALAVVRRGRTLRLACRAAPAALGVEVAVLVDEVGCRDVRQQVARVGEHARSGAGHLQPEQPLARCLPLRLGRLPRPLGVPSPSCGARRSQRRSLTHHCCGDRNGEVSRSRNSLRLPPHAGHSIVSGGASRRGVRITQIFPVAELHAGATVDDPQFHASRQRAGADGDRAPGRRMTYRVGDQIGKHAMQHIAAMRGKDSSTHGSWRTESATRGRPR